MVKCSGLIYWKRRELIIRKIIYAFAGVEGKHPSSSNIVPYWRKKMTWGLWVRWRKNIFRSGTLLDFLTAIPTESKPATKYVSKQASTLLPAECRIRMVWLWIMSGRGWKRKLVSAFLMRPSYPPTHLFPDTMRSWLCMEVVHFEGVCSQVSGYLWGSGTDTRRSHKNPSLLQLDRAQLLNLSKAPNLQFLGLNAPLLAHLSVQASLYLQSCISSGLPPRHWAGVKISRREKKLTCDERWELALDVRDTCRGPRTFSLAFAAAAAGLACFAVPCTCGTALSGHLWQG